MGRLRRLIGAVALASLLALPGPARAEAPAAAAAGDQKALLDLFVNAVQGETVLVLLRPDGDALVPVAELEKAGLHGLGGRREQHDGVEFVLLRSLAPSIRFELDLEKLAVRLTAEPSLLGAQHLDLLESSKPTGFVLHRDPSGFFNYSVTGTTDQQVSGAAELGGSLGNAFAFTGLNVPAGGRLVRGLSQVLVDDPAQLRRATFGDGFYPGGALGGGSLLFGVGVAREFSLDPYFVRAPLPKLQGAVLTPSTLDVYANGQLVRSQQVQPGTFDLRNIPVTTGSGTLSYVLRDAFGRTQELSAPYYASAGLLAAGLSEYTYGFGLRRRNLGLESFGYDPPGLVAVHRLGLTDRLTVGGRLETALESVPGWDAAPGTCCTSLRASGGPSLTIGLPFGELGAEAAVSADGPLSGAAGQLAYSFMTRGYSLGVSARAYSKRYANASLAAASDRALLSVLGFGGVQLAPNASLSLQLSSSSMRDAGLASTASLQLDYHLTRNATLTGAIVRTRNAPDGPEWSGLVALLYDFGNQTTAHAGSAMKRAGPTSDASIQRSLPLDEGVGYQLQAQRDPQRGTTGQGFLQAQGTHGLVSATYSRLGPSDSGSGTVAGSLVVVGGEWFAARPVQQGYALLQVPGVEGVRGYLNNREVGKTDGRGDLLVPGLQPYYGNRLSIAPQDVPMDYEIGSAEQAVATGYRGGALVRFDVRRLRIVSGRLVVDATGKDAIPAFGEMTVATPGRRAVSPIGPQGEFYLENLQPGKYSAAIEYRAGVCRFELDVPAREGSSIDVGSVLCRGLERMATASE